MLLNTNYGFVCYLMALGFYKKFIDQNNTGSLASKTFVFGRNICINLKQRV